MGFSRPNIDVEEVNLGEGGIEAAKARLDAAFSLYYQEIRRVVRHRGLESSLATEVVHDLYIQLSRRPERLEAKTSVGAFLKRAAINLGIDRLRRAAFETRLFRALDAASETVPALSLSGEERLDMQQRIRALHETIGALPRQCRTVFIAHRIADMGKDEIAESLGITRGMVDRHLRKALLHCMERMDAFE